MKISKNRLKKCCSRSQTGKPDDVSGCDGVERSGVPGDEMLHRRFGAETLRDRDCNDQQQKSDRQQPEQVEPSVAANPDARSDTVHLRDRAGPRRLVDHVLARSKLRAVATDNVGRDARLRRRRTLVWRRGGRVSHLPESTPCADPLSATNSAARAAWPLGLNPASLDRPSALRVSPGGPDPGAAQPPDYVRSRGLAAFPPQRPGAEVKPKRRLWLEMKPQLHILSGTFTRSAGGRQDWVEWARFSRRFRCRRACGPRFRLCPRCRSASTRAGRFGCGR